jgi:hypothetical protein
MKCTQGAAVPRERGDGEVKHQADLPRNSAIPGRNIRELGARFAGASWRLRHVSTTDDA